MWRNYLTVGLRALAKNRAYAAINIIGLALGIASCLMILSFVRYEFSYDSWLPDANTVFQVQDYYHADAQGTRVVGAEHFARERAGLNARPWTQGTVRAAESKPDLVLVG